MKKASFVLLLCLTVLFGSLPASGAPARAEEAVPTAEPLVVDLDLSQLSGTVVYAQIYNLMVDYQSYLGKVIRLSGLYTFYEDTTRGVVYHACIVPDATACCSQGIEFVLAETGEGAPVWPDDYPEDGSIITVTGRLETYMEDEALYLHLVDAVLETEEASAEP